MKRVKCAEEENKPKREEFRSRLVNPRWSLITKKFRFFLTRLWSHSKFFFRVSFFLACNSTRTPLYLTRHRIKRKKRESSVGGCFWGERYLLKGGECGEKARTLETATRERSRPNAHTVYTRKYMAREQRNRGICAVALKLNLHLWFRTIRAQRSRMWRTYGEPERDGDANEKSARDEGRFEEEMRGYKRGRGSRHWKEVEARRRKGFKEKFPESEETIRRRERGRAHGLVATLDSIGGAHKTGSKGRGTTVNEFSSCMHTSLQRNSEWTLGSHTRYNSAGNALDWIIFHGNGAWNNSVPECF